MDEFINLVKKLRTDKKITTRQLAKSIDVSQGYLSQLENGHRSKSPSPDIIKKLAVALDYDYFSLMRAAGYLTILEPIDYMNRDFVLTMITSISFEEKRMFISRFRGYLQYKVDNNSIFRFEDKLYEIDYLINNSNNHEENGVMKIDEKYEKELDAFLLTNFDSYAKPRDYLILLRLYRGITVEEMAEKLNVEVEFYKKIEEEIEFKSPLMITWSKAIGIALNVEDLIEWLSNLPEVSKTNFTEKLEYTVEYLRDSIEITFEFPRIIQLESTDSIIKVSDEEAKQRFLYLENLLTMDENIYLNAKVLSKHEKEKALQILKLVFEDDSSNIEEKNETDGQH